MPYEGVNYKRAYEVGYVVAIGLAIALIAIFQPFARAEPNNSQAYGCYVSGAAPSIHLDQSGMTVLQPNFARFGYHLERHKTAITLTADAPIQADCVGERYVYSLYHPGVGTLLDFYHIKGGRRYGQFEERNLRSFTMLANDYTELDYQKASPGECQPLVERS